MPQKPLARALRRHLKPGYCPQNAATACGKGAARDLEAGYCLTLLSEEKRPECCKSLGRRRREAFEARLLPPECSKSLWQGPARDLWQGRRAAKGRRRRGAFEARLLPPECSSSLWQGRREGFGGRLVPNVAF